MSQPHSVCLPGIIAPAVLRYASLLRELGPEAGIHTKELEVYSVTAALLRRHWSAVQEKV